MITDRADIRFRVDAFTTENVAALEDNWDRIETALRVAVQLLARPQHLRGLRIPRAAGSVSPASWRRSSTDL